MYTIFGFYKFKQLKKISKLKDKLQNFIDDYKIKGTIIISPEGINGSISFLKTNTKQIKINLKKSLPLQNLIMKIFLLIDLFLFIRGG